MTPRTPGLDPAEIVSLPLNDPRVQAARHHAVRVVRADSNGYVKAQCSCGWVGSPMARGHEPHAEWRAHLLAADDAHARSRGLVATGDAVRAADVAHAARCTLVTCDRCDALLAALPPSLLDNPEADRG